MDLVNFQRKIETIDYTRKHLVANSLTESKIECTDEDKVRTGPFSLLSLSFSLSFVFCLSLFLLPVSLSLLLVDPTHRLFPGFLPLLLPLYVPWQELGVCELNHLHKT